MYTNIPRIFQNTCGTETGLPEFNLMTITEIMKYIFKKFQLNIIRYRLYKKFSNDPYRKIKSVTQNKEFSYLF